jgi:thioesterase domain-containing protein
LHVLHAVGSRRESDIGNYTIEEMAEIYESEVLPASGDGPVVFAGYSFGALVAFELARRFEARGRCVERLISFDGFAPRFPRLLPIHQRLASHLHALKRADMATRREYLAERFKNVRRRGLRLMGRDYVEYNIQAADAAMNTHIGRLEATLWVAQRSYDPPYTVQCPLLLFKCEKPEKWVGSDMSNPLYGWDTCVSGSITTVTVAGEHLNLFAADNPRLMADAIARQSRSN